MDLRKGAGVINVEPHHFKQENVEMILELFLTDNVTIFFNLGQIVCSIEQSVYNSEHIGVDTEDTQRFGHISL